MLGIPAALLDAIAAAAEAAYPGECCGLLAGTGDGDDLTVTRVVPAANLRAAERNDRFEVDPVVRFHLMRELGDGPERLIGHYHSHPDHPAEPSATDLAMAYEPELVWVIVAVARGKAVRTAAWRLEAGKSRPVPIARL